MQNISFDVGYKSFCINNDESKVVRFNPSDYGLLERFSKARKTIMQEVNSLNEEVNLKADGTSTDGLDETAELIEKVNKIINGQIDYIFDAEVSKIAFGNQSPISTIKGKFLFERFLDAVGPLMEKEIKAEQAASEKRVSKYTKQVK